MRPFVPRFEPEHVKLVADRHGRGDDEKVATTSIKELEYLGVHISSRYDKYHEYEYALDLLDRLGKDQSKLIDNIFVDSKSDTYNINLKPCSKAQAETLAGFIDLTVNHFRMWSNGIYLLGMQGGFIEVVCYPDEDDLD